MTLRELFDGDRGDTIKGKSLENCVYTTDAGAGVPFYHSGLPHVGGGGRWLPHCSGSGKWRMKRRGKERGSLGGL